MFQGMGSLMQGMMQGMNSALSSTSQQMAQHPSAANHHFGQTGSQTCPTGPSAPPPSSSTFPGTAPGYPEPYPTGGYPPAPNWNYAGAPTGPGYPVGGPGGAFPGGPTVGGYPQAPPSGGGGYPSAPPSTTRFPSPYQYPPAGGSHYPPRA